MLDTALLWQWLHSGDPSSALWFVLPFLMATALGATLASLVTWIEGSLTPVEDHSTGDRMASNGQSIPVLRS
jgi:hypothetical protein